MTPSRREGAASNVWCIRGSDGIWCATWRGHKPREHDDNVRTSCRTWIILPWETARRAPTCVDCKKLVSRRRTG